MTSQNDIATLVDGLGGVFRDAADDAARRISAGWPMAARMGDRPAPRNLPVTDWLPPAQANAPEATVGLVDALAAASDGLCWQQTYTREDLGQRFLDRYGWVILVGQEAPVENSDLLAGFLLLGPGVEYPVHKHGVEEVYVILSGRASWKIGDADWQGKAAGSIVHNPSWQPHGMRTDHGEPLLVGFLWNAGKIEKSRMAAADLGEQG